VYAGVLPWQRLGCFMSRESGNTLPLMEVSMLESSNSICLGEFSWTEVACRI
jgi:hypothetical protein